MKHMKKALAMLLAFCVVLSGGWLSAVPAMADEVDDIEYLYGYVNMNYADYYYGELENIEPDGKTTVDSTVGSTDKVTTAGYRKTGFYDAATFATPGSFIFEGKWETWPGTYSEPIKNEFGVVEGGKILGVADVPVAISKDLYNAAKNDRKATTLKNKIAEIEFLEDESIVPVSYKVLNSDATYSKWVGTSTTDVTLTGSLISSYMGDDNWWEGKGFTVDKDKQTIIGGFVEWTDPKGVEHREGLKHDENIYSTTWIGWGVGPNAVGIYGGNEVGWQRFVGMAGGTMTKLSLILMNNEDGSVVYMDGNCGEEGMKSPWLLNGIVEEDGSMPYDVVLKSYEYTKDSVIMEFDYKVPMIDGKLELDTNVYSINYPKKDSTTGNILVKNAEGVYEPNPELVTKYEDSGWDENGHRLVHIELDRSKCGTGRYKYWTQNLAVNSDKSFGTIARWANLHTGLTMKDVHLADNKLVINSDIFSVEDYRTNPYQKVVIKNVDDPTADEVVFSTGDSNTNIAIMTNLIKEDGSIDLEGTYKYTKKQNKLDADGNPIIGSNGRPETENVPCEDPFFTAGPDATYELTMYCGGFPIVHGVVNHTAQEITVAADEFQKTTSDTKFSLDAEAKTALTYTSDNKAVASVSANGTVTVNGPGVATITIAAEETLKYAAASKTVTVYVTLPDEELVYGYVNMNYADYYYGELEGITPDGKSTVTAVKEDPVTAAGYREEGFYDAATFATPGSFIFEGKWETWPGTYSEPIKNEFGVVEGGKILGVADVPVAISKKLLDAAKNDASATVLNAKIAEIEWAEDQSVVPVSYKVLNSDATYTKWIGKSNTDVTLTGSLISSYMGDDNWWEGKGFTVDKAKQTIIGGFVEWTDPKGVEHREGLKHDENIYSTTWIGWGVGPNSVGIYGGNVVGWQRFVGMAGGTMTKLSLILMNNEDGSVVYMDGNCGEAGMKSPWLLNGIVEEDGSMPYDVVLKSYEYTKDRVILDFDYKVPVLADGNVELDTLVYSLNYPKKNSANPNVSLPGFNEEIVKAYEDSGWENGHKTVHIELDRAKAGTGRYKFWTQNLATNGERSFGTIARWANLHTGLTMKDMYVQDSKLVINSDIFTIEDYRTNPYQKVVVKNVNDPGVTVTKSTGDSNTKNNIMQEILKEDGSFDLENATYFPSGVEATYDVTMYCGGFPIVHGTINGTAQEITAADVTKTYGDEAFNLNASAKTTLTYKSSDTKVAAVDAAGNVTVKGAGTADITITALEENGYYAASKTVTVTVNPAKQTITVTKASVTKTYGDAAFSLGAKAKTALTYKTSNSKVATVSTSGKVTIKGAGTATITITAAAGNYLAATKTVAITVNPAKQTITVTKSSVTKTYGAAAFSLGAKAKTSLTYKTSNSKVATVSTSGKVTIKGAGKATITITAKAGNYAKATKKVTITVKPKKVTLSSVKSTTKTKAVVTWKKRAEATGYEVKYSTSSKFSKVKTATITKNATVKKTLTKLTSGKKIYVKVRAYKTVSGKKIYGAYSAVKYVKVK